MAGRPKKLTAEKRDKRISVNLSKSEFNLIASKALASGEVPVPDFVRDVLLGMATESTQTRPVSAKAPPTVKAPAPTPADVAVRDLVTALSGKQTGADAIATMSKRLDGFMDLLERMSADQKAIHESQLQILRALRGGK